MQTIKTWGFDRPHCEPTSGFVMAYTGYEAMKLINHTYGHCNDTEVTSFYGGVEEGWLFY